MIISVINKKGGTGKTTTTINIGKGLSLNGKKVLLVDLDPQGNLSYSLGVFPSNCMVGEAMNKGVVRYGDLSSSDGMDILPSNEDLVNYEFEFIKQSYPYTLLKTCLDSVKSDYDFILVDCPPAGGYLTVNSLIASDAVIIPMQMDVLSLQGLKQILATVKEIKEEYNQVLEVLGVLGVIVDERRQLTAEILKHVQNDFGINVFNNYIHQNVRAAEAPSFGKSLITYAPECRSAKDYISVTNELLVKCKK